MNDESVVSVDFTGNLAHITMANGRLNLWSVKFVDDFELVLDRVTESNARAVVLSCAGNNFSAGGDFSRFEKLGEADDASRYVERIQGLTSKVAAIPVPVIAAMDGVALGGGLELALACDIRVAGARASFGQPESRWGLLPGAGGTQRLPRLIGPGAAKLLMYGAQTIDASEALRLGLVEMLVEDDPRIAAVDLASQIALNSPCSVVAIKDSVDHGLGTTLEQGLAYERELFAGLADDDDLKEGVTAFLEKRSPAYRVQGKTCADAS